MLSAVYIVMCDTCKEVTRIDAKDPADAIAVAKKVAWYVRTRRNGRIIHKCYRCSVAEKQERRVNNAVI